MDVIAATHDSKKFSQKAKRTDFFNSHKAVYMEDPPIPHRKEKKEIPTEPLHDKPFKPSNPPKRGNHCTLEKFPLWKEDPPKEVTRKKKGEDDPEDPPGFKPTYKYRSMPSPSVATNIRNLKASFPSSFARSPVRS